MAYNLFDILNQLDQERYRAIIIHTTPEKSPSLSTFLKKLCQIHHGKYLDLLELFIQDSSLNKKIDKFDHEELRKMLIEQSTKQALLAVDRADFLLDTWRRDERENFYRLINNQWDSFKVSMSAKLIFGLQTSDDIKSLKIFDSRGQKRIFNLNELYEME